MSSDEVEKAVLAAGCLVTGDFKFASGVRATKKVDMEQLAKHPKQLLVVVNHLAGHPALKLGDVILAVPDGAQHLFSRRLSKQLGIPYVKLKKIPGDDRYAFDFASAQDKKLALRAKHPRIIEDTVTTLGSVAGVASLLNKKEQDVQAVVVWKRGKINPKYQQGIKDYYLVDKYIPLV